MDGSTGAVEYEFKIPFWTRQQAEAYTLSQDERWYGLWMDPRTGKSKVCVDTACYHFERPESPLHITGVLVVAWPNGIHAQWVRESFPDNVPDRIPWKGFVWEARKSEQVGYKTAFKEFCATRALAVFAVNAESLISEDCKAYIAKFLKARARVMAIADESSYFATPDSRRNKTMQSLGARPEVIIKRILDGTPVDKTGPLDLYAPVKFLSPTIFTKTYAEFKARYAVMETQGDWEWRSARAAGLTLASYAGKAGPDAELFAERHANNSRGRHWPGLAKDPTTGLPLFRNMDEFWSRLDKISYRATFADCFPDAMKKVYQKRYFILGDKQRKVYDSLRDQFKAEIGGEKITVAHQLTRIMRLQQVTSNFYPSPKTASLHEACGGMGCDECEDGVVMHAAPMMRIDEKNNPRLDALAVELSYGKPAGIWCRYRQEVEDCISLCSSLGITTCRYDGAAKAAEKTDSREGFQSGRYDVIVGNQLSLSRGIPLYRASVMIAYSNMWSYRTRKQVEDRAEHGAKRMATSIVDLVAESTVDDLAIVPALRANADVAAWVLRDKRQEWI